MGQWAEKKKKDRKTSQSRQKNKRGDSKVESNDSPEVPDRVGGRDCRGSKRTPQTQTKTNTGRHGHKPTQI